MAFNTDPKSTNFLSPLGYRFQIKKMPTVNFFAQAVAIPSITVGELPLPTAFSIFLLVKLLQIQTYINKS